MGRHRARRRWRPLVVTGTAGLLAASGPVVGFAPELTTHALTVPALPRAAGPTTVDRPPASTDAPTATPLRPPPPSPATA